MRARISEDGARAPVEALPEAIGSLEYSSEEGCFDVEHRIFRAHAPAQNVDSRQLEVVVYRWVVEEMRDEVTEGTRAALYDAHPDLEVDGVAIGDEVGVLDRRRTTALRRAALRALDLETG